MDKKEYIYENEILPLTEKNKVMGEIYVMTNKMNNMRYVGQTVTHRKNKNKYRPFGSNGRFNDHISEAINNTKKKQCTFLNNAIRKYGKENFEFKLIVRCTLDDLDKMEAEWIKTYNTMHPNGYNLTVGGKTGSTIYTGEKVLNETKKRGRPHGYTHKESTIAKMKDSSKKVGKTSAVKQKLSSTMKNSIRNYYDQKKIDKISTYDLDDNIEQYIKPVCNKDTGAVHDYKIKIDKNEFWVCSETDTLVEKYNRLKNVLIKAKQLSAEKLQPADETTN